MQGVKSLHGGESQADQQRKADKRAQYKRDLEEQMRLKKERLAKEKDAIARAEARKDREIASYNPFGRGGGGAPNSKPSAGASASASASASPAMNLFPHIEKAGASAASPSAASPGKVPMGMNGIDSNALPGDSSATSPSKGTFMGNMNGLIAGLSDAQAQKKNEMRAQYQRDLQEQIRLKNAAKADRKNKLRVEDEQMEAKLQKQRQQLMAEAADANQRAKVAEANKKEGLEFDPKERQQVAADKETAYRAELRIQIETKKRKKQEEKRRREEEDAKWEAKLNNDRKELDRRFGTKTEPVNDDSNNNRSPSHNRSPVHRASPSQTRTSPPPATGRSTARRRRSSGNNHDDDSSLRHSERNDVGSSSHRGVAMYNARADRERDRVELINDFSTFKEELLAGQRVLRQKLEEQDDVIELMRKEAMSRGGSRGGRRGGGDNNKSLLDAFPALNLDFDGRGGNSSFSLNGRGGNHNNPSFSDALDNFMHSRPGSSATNLRPVSGRSISYNSRAGRSEFGNTLPGGSTLVPVDSTFTFGGPEANDVTASRLQQVNDSFTEMVTSNGDGEHNANGGKDQTGSAIPSGKLSEDTDDNANNVSLNGTIVGNSKLVYPDQMGADAFEDSSATAINSKQTNIRVTNTKINKNSSSSSSSSHVNYNANHLEFDADPMLDGHNTHIEHRRNDSFSVNRLHKRNQDKLAQLDEALEALESNENNDNSADLLLNFLANRRNERGTWSAGGDSEGLPSHRLRGQHRKHTRQIFGGGLGMGGGAASVYEAQMTGSSMFVQ